MNLNIWELKEQIEGETEIMKNKVEVLLSNEQELIRMLEDERENNEMLKLELENRQQRE